ncbi:MAG: hypothetical protein QOJ99_4165, partial [Bryobacterales bacterium]|nr:hypothetical protein [Bryobacterales bacterium]
MLAVGMALLAGVLPAQKARKELESPYSKWIGQ